MKNWNVAFSCINCNVFILFFSIRMGIFWFFSLGQFAINFNVGNQFHRPFAVVELIFHLNVQIYQTERQRQRQCHQRNLIHFSSRERVRMQNWWIFKFLLAGVDVSLSFLLAVVINLHWEQQCHKTIQSGDFWAGKCSICTFWPDSIDLSVPPLVFRFFCFFIKHENVCISQIIWLFAIKRSI